MKLHFVRDAIAPVCKRELIRNWTVFPTAHKTVLTHLERRGCNITGSLLETAHSPPYSCTRKLTLIRLYTH